MGREGVRAGWSAIPEPMRAEIDELAGAPIIAVANLSGGFSPGPAARCALADGRRVFVKAAGSSLNPIAPAMHRREARVLRVLPASAPAPKLLGVADDGDWVALVIEWVNGRMPVAPLDRADVAAALGTVTALAAVDASTIREHLITTAGGTFGAGLHGHWSRLLSDPGETLDPWSRRNLEGLADLESSWDDAVRGDSLVHGDIRTDNLLIADARTLSSTGRARRSVPRSLTSLGCSLPCTSTEVPLPPRSLAPTR
jgi:aminoglycoside phosphotransferase (APT) family kinase protein